MGPGDDEHPSGDVADAWFDDELGCSLGDELADGAVVELDLVVERDDPTGDRAHRVAGASLGDRSLRRVREAGAALRQRIRREAAQLMTEFVGSGQHECYEFVEM
jgi:hypothetical protein